MERTNELLRISAINRSEINAFWLKFEPIGASMGRWLGWVLLFICVSSLIGNLMFSIKFRYSVESKNFETFLNQKLKKQIRKNVSEFLKFQKIHFWLNCISGTKQNLGTGLPIKIISANWKIL